MGRDLLAEDYVLKQITASLIYPEGKVGKRFWKRVYEEASRKFGTTNIPVNTFNKVWIVPERALVYENAKAGTAYVVESKLKVMLEQDYLALEKNTSAPRNDTRDINAVGSQIVREIVIPEITKEVNEDKNFSQLRQVYNSLILATWYKKKIKDSILVQVYEDKKKVAGIGYESSVITSKVRQAAGMDDTAPDTEKIYQRYLQAFKKGVYNYIKEENDILSQEVVPRKYFSGGIVFDFKTNMNAGPVLKSITKFPDEAVIAHGPVQVVQMVLNPADEAMGSNGPESLYGVVDNGWNNINELMRVAYKQGSVREKIINNIIVILRLREKAKDDSFFRGLLDIKEDYRRENLINLLESRDVPLYKKRLLLQSFPQGEGANVKLVRGRAQDLEKEVKGLEHPRTGLAGVIRYEIHEFPSDNNVKIVEAYRTFVKTGRKEELKELDFEVDREKDLPWLGNPGHKEKILRACNALLVSLKQMYGRGKGKEDIEAFINAFMVDFLDADQRQEMVKRVRSIIDQKDYRLKDLEDLIKIRQEVNKKIKEVQGEKLFQGLELDLYLETLVHQVFASIKDVNIRFSPEAVLLMFKNNRLNGYGGQLVDQLIGSLENILKQKGGKERDMKLYAVLQRAERMIKDFVLQGISDYQTPAREIGKILNIAPENQEAVDNFSADIFRDNTFYWLSLSMDHLKKKIKDDLGLSEWQAVVEGTMSGKMHFVDNPKQVKDVGKDGILVIDRLQPGFLVGSQVGFIVFELDSLLSHPVIIARQNQIPFIVCPDKKLLKKYKDKIVTITAQGDNVDIVEGTVSDSRKSLAKREAVQVPEANLRPGRFLFPQEYLPQTAGLKAYNLMMSEKMPLAEAQRHAAHMVLSDTLYRDVLNSPSNRRQSADITTKKNILKDSQGDRQATDRNLAKIRNDIESLKIPPDLLRSISQMIRKQIPKGLVFLRSSCNAEDLDNYPGAGLYDSFGGINPDNLEQLGKYIKEVWASVWNDRAYWDRKYNGIDHKKVFMAVLVQEMVNSNYSYVMHTVNPANKNKDEAKDEILLEIVQGLGEGLVSGEYPGTPHRFVYNKRTGKITRIAYSSKDHQLVFENGEMKKKLTDWKSDVFNNKTPMDLVRNLFKQAQEDEQFFGKAQDIEGCIVQKGPKFETVRVQSREQNVDEAMNAGEKKFESGQVRAPLFIKVPDNKTGGIDLTSANMHLQIKKETSDGIKFYLDPAMLTQLQNVMGFVPVIINIQLMTDLRQFLGLNDPQAI
jgi:phosphoenolpyruvate synthase/pyruvate phosphate dikinase